MTIENSHDSTSAATERGARNLDALLRVSKTIASSLDLDHALSATCRAALELLHVSHSSVILLNSDRSQGKVCAEYPELRARDLVIRLGMTREQNWFGISAEPVLIPDVVKATELGAIQQYLLDLHIQSVLIVPIVSEAVVLGYFTLDTVNHARAYTLEEIELCKILAAQAAVAIKNAQLYEETKRRAAQLEALGRTSLAVTPELEPDVLLRGIVEQATALLKAKDGGIFEYYPGSLALMVIVDSSPEGRKKGVTLRAGEGIGGQLLLSDQSYMIVDNYDEWPRRGRANGRLRSAGAVLEVKVRWQGQLIGTLFVRDDVPRKFTEEDARLLMLFADQAAVAMHNAQLVRELREGQHIITSLNRTTRDNLESLSRAVQTLSGRLDPRQVLMMIAEQAKQVLGGDSAIIWPFDNGLNKFPPADLVTSGIPAVGLEEFRGQSTLAGGISRAVMRYGWLCVQDLEAEVPELEFMRDLPRRTLLLKLGVKSFQAAALYVGSEPVGVMYVNYNQPRSITAEDRNSMKGLAELAALVLMIVRNAQLSDERQRTLREQEALVELSKRLLGTVGREEVLRSAVSVARRVLNADCCRIVLPDNHGRLLLVAQEGWKDVEAGKAEMGRERRSETGYIIETGRPSRVADYETQMEFISPEERLRNGIKSGMGVPMFRESQVVGALLVHSRKHRTFTDAEENLLALIANQTAIALHNAEQVRRQTDYLSGLVNASTAISGSGLDRTRVLDEIVKQAFLCLVNAGESAATLATIQLYDEATQTLYFESAYPAHYLQELDTNIGKKRLNKREPGRRIGIDGRALLERKPQFIADVREDPDYYQFLEGTRSELAVPLLDADKVLGVINVESDQPAAFDALHVKELEALAEIAVIAIRNAAQYEELERTRTTAEARTAIALMGMASSVWAHGIRGNANNIRGLVGLMRRKLELAANLAPAMREEFGEKLERLERQATNILEKPLADPLLSAKGLGHYSVREVLKKSVERLLRNEVDASLRVESKLETLDAGVTVHCNSEWLRRAFDMLLDNAVQAMMEVGQDRRLLTVSAEVDSVSVAGEVVKITVADTGPGIPPELRGKLLKTRIAKPGDDGGSGVGLLMARTISEAYGGNISVEYTGNEGTAVVIELPVSRSRADGEAISIAPDIP